MWIEDVWPLSPLQEGLLFHAQYDERSRDLYVEQRTMELAAPLDVAVLRSSWEALLERHAGLRVSFRQPEGAQRLVQVVVAGVPLPWRTEDLSGLPQEKAEAEAARLAEEDHARRFDLAVAPWLRLLLIKLDDSRYRLVVTLHHILLDGWSMPVLFGELAQIYAAGGDSGALPPATPYRDYLAWLSRQDQAAAREAWRAELAGLSEPTLVAPADTGSAPVQPEHVAVRADSALTAALDVAARAHGVTLNTVVQAAWAMLVGQLTGRADVVFGTVVAGRPADLPGVEHMLGLFINAVPVRVRLDPGQSVAGLLTNLQVRQAGLFAHQHLGLADIQREAGAGATFDTLVVYQNYPRPPGGGLLDEGGLRITGTGAKDAAHYPLLLGVVPGEEMEFRADYRPDLFGSADVRALLARLLRLLAQFAADLAQPVGRLDVLEPAEWHAVLDQWQGAAVVVPSVSVPELFAVQVARVPGGVAVVDGDVSLT
ncbi:MAG TPA: condensation domain-containing protein [Amycolatopsis sp.]|uniref:condensation domain-containing protein n=1 Tax=Amycolatopsis sp. TaxID=37632 RepID=UPI002B480E23|nr:condensation domain-containing protein [Amycolatopsis sp.]HKS44073.1 condensation domain-containing protein [Amycolatopsis sp.]